MTEPTYRLHPVGVVASPLTDRDRAPKQGDEGAPPARVVWRPEVRRAAADLQVGERVLVLTHTNVGYKDHPLQKHFPASASPVRIESGSFVGANATLLPGITVGAGSFVAAGAVVNADVPPGTLVAGVPARHLRALG